MENLKKEYTDFAEDIIFWVCNKGTKTVSEIVEERVKAINYAHSSTQLKRERPPGFPRWRKINKIKRVQGIYTYKGKEHSYNSLYLVYKEEVPNTF